MAMRPLYFNVLQSAAQGSASGTLILPVPIMPKIKIRIATPSVAFVETDELAVHRELGEEVAGPAGSLDEQIVSASLHHTYCVQRHVTVCCPFMAALAMGSCNSPPPQYITTIVLLYYCYTTTNSIEFK